MSQKKMGFITSIHRKIKNPKSREDKFNILIFLLFPIIGFLSLVWFLIRVIPKPSRATYPCQRAAFPLATSFIIWLIGLTASAFAYRRASRLFGRARYVGAVMCLVAGIVFLWMTFATDSGSITFIKADTPTPNQPIGVAKGVNPGRVVWMHNAAAATWHGSNDDSSQPYWYTDTCTDPQIVSEMLSKSIKTLAGTKTDTEAWDAIFHNFNMQKGRGDVGYQPGEKISIKINGVLNLESNHSSKTHIENAPQLAIALLKQLINEAGVAPEDISIGDPQNPMVDYWYNMVHEECPGVVYLCSNSSNQTGRTKYSYDYSAPFYFSDPDQSRWVGVTRTDYVPDYLAQADYFINFPVLKSHNSAGVTLAGKNHYGSLMRAPNAAGYYDEHNTRPANSDGSGEATPGMGHYRANVDLMGHPKLGGKTLLVLIDGLYGGRSWNSQPIRWEMAPFNGNWPSSIFLSQDQVAADSVAFDFLYNEWDDAVGSINGYPQYSGTEDYLHEAALAGNPPSGTFYDPAHDGGIKESLGVHEHWNNPIDKQYSRNLGTGDGIELIKPSMYTTSNGPIKNVTTGNKYDYIEHAIIDASSNDQIIVSPGVYNESIDFAGKKLTISSSNPNDPNIVASTIIQGTDIAVTFANGEDENSILKGFTITNSNTGIFCFEAAPTISNCKITDNKDDGILLQKNSNPNISDCEISCNEGNGIAISDIASGRASFKSMPSIENCVIAANRLNGIYCNMPIINNCTISANGQIGIAFKADEKVKSNVSNSIIYGNNIAQIEDTTSTVEYSNIQGGWTGAGNIDLDPQFAQTGFWDMNDTPEDLSDDTCLAGDYHLFSEAGRWVPSYPSQADPNVMVSGWLTDAISSPCIDAADPNAGSGNEVWPHGTLLNMGAYGGSTQASLSMSDEGDIKDIDNDGAVTCNDMLQLTGKWGCETSPLKEDLNIDGIVDINDLLFFESNWIEDSNNAVPQIDAIEDVNASAGELISFTVSANDTDGDDLVYLAVELPAGATFEEQAFNWTPEQEGEYQVTFIVSDDKSMACVTIQVTVEPGI